MKVLLYRPGYHRAFLAGALHGYAASVEVYGRPDEVLQQRRAGNFDLYLIGCIPAPEDGFELCQQLLQNPSAEEALILPLAAGQDLDFLQRLVELGVDDILTAPLERGRLRLRLQLATQRLQAKRSTQAAKLAMKSEAEEAPLTPASLNEKLEKSEERFRRLVQISPDTVALHAEGKWLFINPVGLDLLGADTADQILGQPVRKFVAPGSEGLLRDRVKQAHQIDKPIPVAEERMVRLDGQVIHVEVVGLPSTFGGRQANQLVIRDVTQRKRTEEALKRSEQRYRDLFEGVPVGIYRIDIDGRVQTANRAVLTLLGLGGRSEALGIDTGGLYAEQDDRRAWSALMQHDGQVPNFETQIRRPDGNTIWVRSNSQAVTNAEGKVIAYEGTVEDITDRKRAEYALRKSEERFRSMVQNASDMICILDADARVRYLSPSTIRLLGFAPHERIGHPGFERIHPDDRPRIDELFTSLVEKPGESLRAEYKIRHGDGQWRVLESNFTNLLQNPAVRGVVLNSRDISDRKEAEGRLIHDALHDALTGLPNRVLFMDRLGHCLDRVPRRKTYRCAVLFLDLDRFKMVNDSFGHAIGDLLLVQVSRRLRGCLRPTDTLARLGGDEFAILLDDLSEAGHAVRVAQRIQEELENPFPLEGREVYSSTSIGIALSTPKTQDPEELLRDADTAMYRAKSRGRAAYAIFDARMHAQVRSQLRLETDFRRAIDQWQFEVFYQPIVLIESGAIAGFEALLRWRHPKRGLVMPEEFIPLAEETGLINPLGHRVLIEACQQVKTWNESRPQAPPLFITVNLSNRQFVQQGFVDQVEGVLASTGLPGRRLYLELTETTAMENPETVLDTLKKLKQHGIRISLDNFGTGYSSLNVLHNFPFDKVKIDRWFVRNIGADRGNHELVEGVLALCQWRQLETVATGVETPEQRRKLTQLNCTYAQGFLFSDPVESAKAEELLRLPQALVSS